MPRLPAIIALSTLCPTAIGSPIDLTPKDSASDLALRSDKAASSPQALISFLGGVDIAVGIVRDTWPTAQLTGVYGVPSTTVAPGTPLTDATDLGNLTACFNLDAQSRAVIADAEDSWSIWDEPTVLPGAAAGPVPIAWPPGKETWNVDLDEAADLVVQATGMGFFDVGLFQPLNGGDTRFGGVVQPYYYFTMTNGTQWRVGARNRWVFPPGKSQDHS